MSDISNLLNKVRNLHANITSDVWPDGATMTCNTCGKTLHLSTDECGYCLAHVWPKCHGHDMSMTITHGEVDE